MSILTFCLDYQVTVSGGLASVAAVDVMVTASITWYLRRKRNEVQEYARPLRLDRTFALTVDRVFGIGAQRARWI